jgi:xylosylprotein 4-beta-galactosyltransferase
MKRNNSRHSTRENQSHQKNINERNDSNITSINKISNRRTWIDLKKLFRTGIFHFLLGFVTCGLLFSISFTIKSDVNQCEDDLTGSCYSFETNSLEGVEQNQNFKKVSNDSQRKLAIVVPFRDRFDELLEFVPHISKFLVRKGISFKIFVINQVDKYRFNRAALINLGFLYSMKSYDYMAMHDVDLLPLSEHLDYSYPLNGPFHVSSPGIHPEYDYPTFIGGILIVTKEQFLKTNGMSNRYWGWGREDDDFYNRLKATNQTVQRPDLRLFNSTGKRYTFRHNHDSGRRPRDNRKFVKQRKEALKPEPSGLDSLQYRIVSTRKLEIDSYSCEILNVELFCNKIDTHWCEFTHQFYSY